MAASHAYPLGNRQPPGYVGYLDEDRGEVYAYSEKTGECCYGGGADGDVFAVDYDVDDAYVCVDVVVCDVVFDDDGDDGGGDGGGGGGSSSSGSSSLAAAA